MRLLFFTVFIDLIGFGIIIPIIPFLAPEFGASNMDIALIIAVYSVCSGLLGGAWGSLSDRVGRKPVLIGCLLLTSLSYVMLAFAQTLLMVYIARIVAGCAAGIYGVAAATVADLTDDENRAKNMGVIGAAFGLGMVFGPFLGGVLAGDELNFVLPASVAAVLSLSAAIFCFVLMPESLPKELRKTKRSADNSDTKKLWPLLGEIQSRWLISLYVLHSIVISVTSYLFPLWTAWMLGWGPKEIGIVFGVQGLMMAALQGKLVGVLVAKFGELALLSFGITLLTLGFSVASQADAVPLVIISFFCIISGATICSPVLNSILSKRVPAQYRGKVMGTSSAMGSWGRVIGPLIAGVVLTQSGYVIAWGIGIIIGFIFILWPLKEMLKAKEQQVEA